MKDDLRQVHVNMIVYWSKRSNVLLTLISSFHVFDGAAGAQIKNAYYKKADSFMIQ